MSFELGDNTYRVTASSKTTDAGKERRRRLRWLNKQALDG
jgi:hypothetical protein